jgi:hypothetical protein
MAAHAITSEIGGLLRALAEEGVCVGLADRLVSRIISWPGRPIRKSLRHRGRHAHTTGQEDLCAANLALRPPPFIESSSGRQDVQSIANVPISAPIGHD